MKLHPSLIEARFVSRTNRFAVLMVCEGRETVDHVANSGRLKELSGPGNPMLLAPAAASARLKTAYDLAPVEVNRLNSFIPGAWAGKIRMLIKGR